MTDLRQAAQQALEALGLCATGRDMDAVALNDLIFRLEGALAQQAEPVQRKPLTEEEATALVQSVVSNSDRPIGMVAYGLLVVGAVERAHGIGDNT